jgi:AraC-like DNA-binding protein
VTSHMDRADLLPTGLTGPRTLPVGIKPLPGESLESWLASLARHLDVEWGKFLSSILPRALVSNTHSVFQVNLTAHLTEVELNAISAATGIDAPSIEALTWHRFDGIAGTVDRARRRMQMTWKFARSRYCPVCLRNSHGRWQLQWRLPWVFACQQHLCLLADTCPACHQTQRTNHGWLSSARVVAPELCCANESKGGRCATPLSTTPTIALTEGHPFIRAQAFLCELLSGDVVTFGLYQRMPATTEQFLRDLRLLSLRIAEATDGESLGTIAQLNSVGECDTPDIRQWRASPNTPRTPPALIAAAGISSTLELLRCSSLDEAADRVQPFVAMHQSSGRYVDTANLTTKTRNPIADAVMVRALTNAMSASDQLRYRAHSPLPRCPQKLPAAMLRSTPTCLWSDWAIRILPVDRTARRGRATARAVLAMLLVTVSNQAYEAEIAKHLGLERFGPSWARKESARIAVLLRQHPLWVNIATALTRLSDYLADHPSPIDYARRRRLDYRKLLPDNEWDAIFNAADFGRLDRAHTGQRVRTWLFERISMLPAEMSPFPFAGNEPADTHKEAVELLAPPVGAWLDHGASRFLKRHKVIDEPLVWSPPLSVVADLELPGPDIGSLSLQDFHEALLNKSMSIYDVAKSIKAQPRVVRHLLEQTPLPRPVCRGQHRPHKQTRLDRARLQLPRVELARLYEHEKWTFVAIATCFSIDPKAVRKLAAEYGIQVAPVSTRRRRVVNADWLRHEYTDKERTLTGIAQEAGISRKRLSMSLKEMGLPVRRGPLIRPRVPITEEWIRQEHLVNERTLTDMAQEAGISRNRLSMIVGGMGIPVRQRRRTHPRLPITEEWIRQQHVVAKRTLTDMAQEAGVTPKVLRSRANEIGIAVGRDRQFDPTTPGAQKWMYREHVLNQRSLRDMAQEIDVTYRTLSKWMKAALIPVRRSRRP